MLLNRLMDMQGKTCSCGKDHRFQSRVFVGKGVTEQLVTVAAEWKVKKIYVLADENTFRAAGEYACRLLKEERIPYVLFCYSGEKTEPDEKNVGIALMRMPSDCDMILAVGSGVINDIAKILASRTRLPFVILATAPSMDGYASMTSSVTLDGIKVSLPSRCADVIIGDINLIGNAPKKMLLAGIGDMLAKYISLCEWRIAACVLGEYYCEEIASLIREALRLTVESAPLALKGDEIAVQTVFEALIVGSVAMNYAGCSRPASGVEHYISHLYDTRGIEFGEETELHGIQCAISTVAVVGLYEKLTEVLPDREKALRYAEEFDSERWNETLRSLLGKSAQSLIELEKKEGKYDRAKHSERLNGILNHWDEIVQTVKEEIPSSQILKIQMERMGFPRDFFQVGMRGELLGKLFCASKDIRDKYVLSRLLWDLGLLEEFAERI